MLSKSFSASIFLLALTSSVNADCIITPALGISGIPAAGDVQLKLLQKPSDTVPCGNASFIQYLDSSEPIKADQSGQFTPSITNYDTGDSSSRLIQTVKVDQTGTGEHFADAQMVANGDQNPTSEGTQELTVKLPDGIKCAGGSGKNRCLASFVTASGHGNCVVVTQAGNNVKRSASGDEAKPKPIPPPKKDKKKVVVPPAGDNVERSTSEDEEKPKPAPPPKKNKKKVVVPPAGSNVERSTSGDEAKPKPVPPPKKGKKKGGKKI